MLYGTLFSAGFLQTRRQITTQQLKRLSLPLLNLYNKLCMMTETLHQALAADKDKQNKPCSEGIKDNFLPYILQLW